MHLCAYRYVGTNFIHKNFRTMENTFQVFMHSGKRSLDRCFFVDCYLCLYFDIQFPIALKSDFNVCLCMLQRINGRLAMWGFACVVAGEVGSKTPALEQVMNPESWPKGLSHALVHKQQGTTFTWPLSFNWPLSFSPACAVIKFPRSPFFLHIVKVHCLSLCLVHLTSGVYVCLFCFRSKLPYP